MIPFTIFKRLILGNLVILLLVIACGAAVVLNLREVQDLSRQIVEKDQESIIAGDRLTDAFESLVKLGDKYVVSKDVDYYYRFLDVKAKLEFDFHTFIPLMETPVLVEQAQKAQTAFTEYLAWFEDKKTVLQNGNSQDVDRFLSQSTSHLTRTHGILLSIREGTRKAIDGKTRRSGKITQQTLVIALVTTAVTVLAGIFITLINARWIRSAVTRLKHQTHDIANGKFEIIQEVKGPKEIRDLAHRFNEMCRQLAEVERLKADFLSHVSHELRTPVTSIKEASVMLSKGFYADAPEKQQQLFEVIRKECTRLLNSVVRILDFSKMEAGKMAYSRVACDLTDVIRKSVLLLAPLAQKKAVSLEFLVPPDDLPQVRVDEDRIMEVLDNLIGNALKFTPENGRVTIGCSREKKTGHLKVTVQDNGPGIALEHLEKIFYKFKQIDSGRSTRMGTGLGLSISKYIITAHGGTIWAQSEPAKGTTILFTLPVLS